jgi:alkanesulfonate monooxygenase SsuD/methylene tetrahydromethanopterin reductase-like flavin-dependent oxidoreductase (luciferase family)
MTSRIRFYSGVIVLTLHHPIQFAERVGMLDLMSGGRFDCGIGRGYQRRAFEGLNIPMEDSAERFDEYLDIATRAWAPGAFSYKGKYYQTVDPIEVFPKPLQQPHPPIYIAGVSFHSLEKIGRSGHGMLKNLLDNLDTCKEQVDAYKRARRAAGFPESGDRVKFVRLTVVDETQAKADAVAEPLMRKFNELFSGAVRKPPVGDSYKHYQSEQYLRDRNADGFNYERQAAFSIFGGPELAIERLTYIRDEIGANEVVFSLGFAGMPLEVSMRTMTILAEKVFPHFR